MKTIYPLNKFYNLLILHLSILILASCGAAIQPNSPEISVEEKVLPKQASSSIKVPIKINLAPYFEETNQSVPSKFTGNEQVCQGVSYSYKFLREPIEFKGAGDKLQFDVDGKYSLYLNYCPQCTELFDSQGTCLLPRVYVSCGVNEPMRKIHVGYDTKIGVSEYYKLVSKTKLRTVKALSPCEVTSFNYDATETLEEELTTALQAVESDIDKEISAVDLKPDMEATWKALSDPIDLAGYGYLYVRPKSMSMSQIRFEGDTAYFNALLEAKPTIFSDQKEIRQKKLPKLSKYQDREGFDITMDIVGKYDSLSSILTKSLKGTSVDLSGREVIFGDIEIHGAYNSMIHLKVGFSGKKKGTLYLTGTPVFDANEQHISFPDLNFDIDTKSALLKSAKWLFDKKITNAIRDAASMDLKPYLDTLKTTLNESLNMEITDGVFLKGKVKDVEINLIHPKQEELYIRIHSIGDMELEM